MEWCDVILSIDWLSSYWAVIDYAWKRVSLHTKNGQIVYKASQHAIRLSTILRLFLEGKRRLEMYSSLFAIYGDMGIGIDHLWLMMVDEFFDVFTDELSSLPPDKEIEFSIDMVLRSQIVSIAPYRMAPAELIEL